MRFSPDGKWIVYESDETGRPEIFIQLLSGDAPRRQVSIDGGNYPRWSHDGQALFWTALDGKMMTTTVRRVPDLETSVPVPLFDSRLLRGGGGHYDVRPDGGFIMQTLEERPADEVHVIMNWPTLLKH